MTSASVETEKERKNTESYIKKHQKHKSYSEVNSYKNEISIGE